MKLFKTTFSLILAFLLIFSFVSVGVSAATTPTGYTKASDVRYNITQGAYKGKAVVANWGAHDEVATFLSTYAEDYYTGSYTFETLSQNSGGTTQSNAYQSALHSALKQMMTTKHKTTNSYNDNRTLLKFTDCVNGDTSKICFFYSGTLGSSTWDSGKTWNREHTWPNSKGDETSQEDDIMMIRPALSRENSSRGNKAYGESSGFYDPGKEFRGDCARIVLYIYTRYGNSTIYAKTWGKDGVMENLTVLLRWMQEDPVDTWEMGRNDAVQSITGTRNVFVDYPEFAWLLFGEDIPKNMTTPSGKAKQIGTGSDTTSSSGSTSSGTTSDSSSSSSTTSSSTSSSSGVCNHTNVSLKYVAPATCKSEGYSGDVVCNDCGHIVTEGQSTNRIAHISNDGNYTCDVCGAKMDCIHKNSVTENNKDATCIRNGYSGDEVCTDCKAIICEGFIVPKTGVHAFGEWHVPSATDDENAPKQRICTECGLIEREPSKTVSEPIEKENTSIIIFIIIGALAATAVVVVLIVIIIKKKK